MGGWLEGSLKHLSTRIKVSFEEYKLHLPLEPVTQEHRTSNPGNMVISGGSNVIQPLLVAIPVTGSGSCLAVCRSPMSACVWHCWHHVTVGPLWGCEAGDGSLLVEL